MIPELRGEGEGEGGSLALLKLSRAKAALDGRDFVANALSVANLDI